MRITYNEILRRMKAAYFEHCGETVTDFSDVAARLEAVASELFSLASMGDYVLRQAFPQSATGEYLDFHAALRDITRKSASFSAGEVTFSVNEAAQNDITIPAGTICSAQGKPYVQFVTDAAAVLEAGELSVSVAVTAAESGYEHNVGAGEVTVMVNPPAGIDSVINAQPFTGGSVRESDDALRKRIIASYSIPQTGFSLNSVKEGLLKNEEILDCKVSYDSGEINVALRLVTGSDFATIAQETEDKLELAQLLGCTVNVIEAAGKSFSLCVEVKVNSADSEDVREQVINTIEKQITGVGIGEDIYLNKLVYYVSAVDGVEFCEISSPSEVEGVVLCPQNKYLSLANTEVSCYE